jgi:hypothetical protein
MPDASSAITAVVMSKDDDGLWSISYRRASGVLTDAVLFVGASKRLSLGKALRVVEHHAQELGLPIESQAGVEFIWVVTIRDSDERSIDEEIFFSAVAAEKRRQQRPRAVITMLPGIR